MIHNKKMISLIFNTQFHPAFGQCKVVSQTEGVQNQIPKNLCDEFELISATTTTPASAVFITISHHHRQQTIDVLLSSRLLRLYYHCT